MQSANPALTIPHTIWNEMIAHAKECAPHECCGMLAGTDGTVLAHYRITNILQNLTDQELSRFDGAKLRDLQCLLPEERADIAFQMDAREMALAQKDIRAKGFQLQAFYHSHTSSPARPSQTDITIAMEFESYREKLGIPQPLHIIISLADEDRPDIKAFRIADHASVEVPLACEGK
ncbi:MAG: M67 family peptidase [Nitrospirae bacterium]|nr:MAG: M67 family peptidase [Nitrospirota bacterium]